MKILKSINNNVALCMDSAGNQLVVFGKGVGFHKTSDEVELSKIERTYYDVDVSYIAMINEIPEDIIKISDKIVLYARQLLDSNISSNLVFTLADHIHFCIQRYKKNLVLNLPIANDIEQLFEEEMKIGRYGVELIKEKYNILLPKEEVASIAIHIINAQEKEKNSVNVESDELINEITKIIEDSFHTSISREDFNYSRFVSHMHYLLKRLKEKRLINTKNKKIYETLITSYKETYECTEKISIYLKDKMKIELNDEEKLYLMLHVNRLCIREDCYQ
ncbi:PRD domain-containing protein [Anaerorhabdus furcosa]|uniref:Transcriptional antiterminator, BglG family n=1 Tax=Anaerorhabdus furcosa TaxID=118967 RepID=A0A1T4L5R7_9FIRM|nr:PRD domain-containing protein [Anaerorhabdus furcosa]SJZ50004.1 transcriptional antiterminator, BglG family [Anaerorhabdus furcosa]